jgi:superfamily I DNA/RNA helicase
MGLYPFKRMRCKLGTVCKLMANEMVALAQRRQLPLSAFLPPHGYGPDYLRLANLETATGLEAEVVFLLGMESLLADGAPGGDRDDALRIRREADARKRYMAMTRASRRLVLVV